MERTQRINQALTRLLEGSRREWDRCMAGTLPVVLVGTGTCGRAAGALETSESLHRAIEEGRLEASIVEVGCNGHCYAEPLVTVHKAGWPPILYGNVTPGVASVLVQRFLLEDDPCLEYVLGALEPDDRIPSLAEFPRSLHEERILLEQCGRIDPENIGHALANGAYSSLARALCTDPEEIVDEVRCAQLKGLGGAGYETWRKWEVCRSSDEKERYVICNADEGDPGAFMDRSLLEGDPHKVIEGMAICAWAVEARKGYVYVRAEYPLAVERVRHALAQSRDMGLIGAHILESGFSFDLDVVQAPGAFVCGEETALIASIEGKRGMPRIRSPYPAEKGLWGKPTVVNNVKTFASVPSILSNGWENLVRLGPRSTRGTTLFALAGKVLHTGLVEVPMGTTLRRLIFDMGGGIPGGKRFKAVQIGGPSGGCLPEEVLDTPVGFTSLKEVGAMMGSGGMVVLDEDNCMVDTALFFLGFIQKESCGKCTFCRIGTKQMLEILRDIAEGRGTAGQLHLLRSLAEDIQSGSLCNLGKTAPNPILTTLKYFKAEYEAHIRQKCCPARVCHALTAYYILPEKCERSCDACVGSCPTESIFSNTKRIKVIEQSTCIKCGACLTACPPQYNAVVKVSPLSELPDTGKREDEGVAE